MALKYQGHTFADHAAVCSCCVVRDAKVLSDPTRTGAVRSRLRAVMALRWRSMRVLVREVIVNNDVLGLKNAGLTAGLPMLSMGGTRIQMFKRWWDQAATTIVMGADGSVFRRTIDDAYEGGAGFASKQVGKPVTPGLGASHKEALLQWAIVELQGIQDAVGQKVLRAVSTGILNKHKPMMIVREVWKAIDGAAIHRSGMLVETLVTKAFSDGSLDAYEDFGHETIGIMPEAKKKVPALGDAAAKPKKRERKGAGSRIGRTEAPSESTIRRIRKEQREVERTLGRGVYIRTRGDDDVCPICEDLSEEGPYTINEARSLIPAHPNCRCAFIPAHDRRFKRNIKQGLDGSSV